MSQTNPDAVLLGRMALGEQGTIAGYEEATAPPAMIRRLLEMGLVEGAEVEIAHQAPLGGDPIAVRVRGGLIALRRSEANCIRVTRKENHG